MIRTRGGINSPRSTTTKGRSSSSAANNGRTSTPKAFLTWIRRSFTTPLGILSIFAFFVLLYVLFRQPSSVGGTFQPETQQQQQQGINSLSSSFLRATTSTTTSTSNSEEQESMMKYHQRAYVSNELVQKAVNIRSTCLEHIRSHHDRILKPLLERPSSPLFEFEAESILLVDPAYHSNVGDHMLTVAEQIYLQRLGWTTKEEEEEEQDDNNNNEQQQQQVDQDEDDSHHHPAASATHMECHYVQSANLVPTCTPEHLTDISKMARVAMWHAGGNWGDLWRDAQDVRLASMDVLLGLGFVVVGMPQSLYYKNQDLEERDSLVLRKKVKVGLKLNETHSETARKQIQSKLILTWREKESYQKAKELYPFARNELVPDIAFQLGPYEPIRRQRRQSDGGGGSGGMVDILLFLRQDYESQVSDGRSNEAIQHLLQQITKGSSSITFRIVDWDDRLELLNIEQDFFTSSSVELLSMGKIVIADRLHAAILSYLSGLPFVFIDQVSQKLTRTLGVAFHSWRGCQDIQASMYRKATSLENALEQALNMLEEYNLR